MNKYVKRALIAAGAIVAALFLLQAPGRLTPEIEHDAYLDFFSSPPREWEGVVRVWNVYTEDRNAGADMLKKCVKTFEKQRRGVYVELVSVTPEQMRARLDKNVAPPDVYIYPEDADTGLSGGELMFEVRLPEEKNVVVSDFEFDVNESEEEQQEQAPGTAVFMILVNCDDEDRAEVARDFAALVANTAAGMLK